MMRHFQAALFTGVMLCAGACSGDTHSEQEGTESQDAGTNEASESDAPLADDAEESTAGTEMTFILTINDWISGEALEGAKVCSELSDFDCTTTDAEGKATFIGLVSVGDVGKVTIELEGYFPVIIEPVVTSVEEGAVNESTWVLAPLSSLELLTGALGTEIDATKGHATLLVFGPADEEGVRPVLPHVTVDLDLEVEIGPKYVNGAAELGTLGPFGDDEDGSIAGGTIAFFNITPGNANFTVNAPGFKCSPGLVGLNSDSGSIAGTIEAGHVTYLLTVCEEDADALVEVTNEVSVSDWLSTESLEGVTLCASGNPEICATTDAEGVASLTGKVAEGQRLHLRADKEGYYPFFVEGIVNAPVDGSVVSTNWVMGAIEGLGLLTAALGTELDEAAGQVTMVILGPADAEGTRSPVEGALVTTSATSETGPKYLNAADDFGSEGPFGDDEAGTTLSGTVGLFNVNPGRVEFDVNVEGHICGPGAAGLPANNATLASHVEAGRATYVFAVCDAE